MVGFPEDRQTQVRSTVPHRTEPCPLPVRRERQLPLTAGGHAPVMTGRTPSAERETVETRVAEPDTPEPRREPESVLHVVAAPGFPPQLTEQARIVLLTLRIRDPRLILTATDLTELAPAVNRWLSHGIQAEQIGDHLTLNLPRHFRTRPARLLAYRLAEPPPALPAPTPSSPPTPGRPATAANAPSAPPNQATAATARRPAVSNPVAGQSARSGLSGSRLTGAVASGRDEGGSWGRRSFVDPGHRLGRAGRDDPERLAADVLPTPSAGGLGRDRGWCRACRGSRATDHGRVRRPRWRGVHGARGRSPLAACSGRPLHSVRQP